METKLLTILAILTGLASTTAPVLGAPWTPIATNTALWLDAADPATVLTSGSSATNWLDKSGHDRHVLQENVSYQPTYGIASINSLNAIGFLNDALQTGTNDLATWLNNTNYHFIAVLQHNASGYYVGTDSAEGGGAVLHIGQRTSSSWRHGHFGNDGDWSHVLDTTPLLAVSSFNNTGSATFMNGTSIGSSSKPGVPLNTDGPLSIGKPVGLYARGNLGYYSGSIGEVICITGDLTTSGRQQLEGYLAHKWKIEDNLPADHPYKDEPPTIPDAGTLLIIE